MKLIKFLTLIGLLLNAALVKATLISVDPDDFVHGTDLGVVFPGVALSVVGIDVDSGYIDPEVFSISTISATTGVNLFGNKFGPDLYTQGWSQVAHALRVDFDVSTDFISIDMRGRNNSTGVIYAYNDAGMEIATYFSNVLTSLATFEVATINRIDADISYLLIGGDQIDVVRLDNLKYNQVPEPPTIWLLVACLISLVRYKKLYNRLV